MPTDQSDLTLILTDLNQSNSHWGSEADLTQLIGIGIILLMDVRLDCALDHFKFTQDICEPQYQSLRAVELFSYTRKRALIIVSEKDTSQQTHRRPTATTIYCIGIKGAARFVMATSPASRAVSEIRSFLSIFLTSNSFFPRTLILLTHVLTFAMISPHVLPPLISFCFHHSHQVRTVANTAKSIRRIYQRQELSTRKGLRQAPSPIQSRIAKHR